MQLLFQSKHLTYSLELIFQKTLFHNCYFFIAKLVFTDALWIYQLVIDPIMVSKRVNSPHKIWPPPPRLWLLPSPPRPPQIWWIETLPSLHLFAPPNPINITTMQLWQGTIHSFFLNLVRQAILLTRLFIYPQAKLTLHVSIYTLTSTFKLYLLQESNL